MCSITATGGVGDGGDELVQPASRTIAISASTLDGHFMPIIPFSYTLQLEFAVEHYLSATIGQRFADQLQRLAQYRVVIIA